MTDISGEDKTNLRVEILRDIEHIVTGDRNQTYGEPEDNFSSIAEMWSLLFRKKLAPGETFSPEDVGYAMIGLKLARQMNEPKRDNMIDIGGYTVCLQEIIERRAKLS